MRNPVPRIMPSSSPLLLSPPLQELVMFVGYPCLGKTSFYRRYFKPAGYEHINQDTLKTRDKCVKAMQHALQEGKSCVIGEKIFSVTLFITRRSLVTSDNTNRNAATRKYYIDVATKLNIPIRYHNLTALRKFLSYLMQSLSGASYSLARLSWPGTTTYTVRTICPPRWLLERYARHRKFFWNLVVYGILVAAKKGLGSLHCIHRLS